MTGRRAALIAVLLRMYPHRWRGEYGAELEAVLHSSALTLRIVLNVLWNGLWQRGRLAWRATTQHLLGRQANTPSSSVAMPRLWRRACLACFVMWIATAIIGGLELRHTAEFGSFAGGALFTAIVTTPWITSAAFIIFLPAVTLARAIGKACVGVRVLLAGLLGSPFTFAVIVSGGWVLSGMRWSLYEHLTRVIQPRAYWIFLPVYALGAAIVASALRVPRSTSPSPVEAPHRVV